ncbi:putative oxidoreductase T05C12.3 [Toxocara canis]|uniref:Putative oxidoreductase T05C12.3 n=1 Tax=Toxocara canis TaxID=6265 RepID=A0A0B2VG15_TOXCA|nr:putative oxidoreductase T05C12.3 [Toxocara canis]
MACKTPFKFFPPCKTPALVAKSMSGKVALVTGGGTGIGRAIATTFASLGATVAIAARRFDVLEKTATEIRERTGAEVFALQMDVRKTESVRKTIDDIESKSGGPPTVVVNGAAGNFIMATERLSANAIRAVIDIVLMGTINVTVEVASRGCAFLVISTPYARNGAPFVVPSAVSKAGIENLTRSLATEWAKYGMRFNAIAPGPVPTEGAMGRLSTMSLEEAAQSAARTVPLGRCGEPEELANMAAFICSDYGSWLNGAIVDMDGGQQYMNHGSSFGPQLHDMTDGDWAAIETLIRERTGRNKV